jgi:hypothetical protein
MLTLFLLAISTISSQSLADTPTPFTPPNSITVTMNRLTYPTGGDTGIACGLEPPDENWDCTWFDQIHYPQDKRPYPYTSNPVTVPTEADYLLDVVPQEMSPDPFHPIALQAQAIAARSYAYWHIVHSSTINNSNAYQVFVPLKFESLLPVTFPDNQADPCASANLNGSQQRVCDAVAPQHYVSYDEQPAFTEFFADIRTHTLTNTTDADSDGELDYPYLHGVEDPISWEPTIVQNGHGHGISQKGASRWGWGNSGSYGNLTPWSVQWERAEQVLVHYYTGVHLRDSAGAQLVGGYRWNPLRIDWHTPDNRPPTVQHGGAYSVTVQAQNTSVYDWPAIAEYTTFVLSYRWAKPGFEEEYGRNQAPITTTVPQGASYTFTLTLDDLPEWGPCDYVLKLDMAITVEGRFWFSEIYGWPTYDVALETGETCRQLFLPLALKTS